MSGYFSFSVLGQTDYPTTAHTVNVADRHDRFVVADQARKGLDGTLPILNAILEIDRGGGVRGTSRDRFLQFVLIAHSNKRENKSKHLFGVVKVYRPQNWAVMKGVYRDIQESLEDLEDATRDVPALALRRGAPKVMRRASNKHRLPSDPVDQPLGEIRFMLRRNGVISMRLVTLGDDYVRVEDEAAKDEFAFQAFYFVRDMLHRHQHHSPSSDLLTTLHRVGDAVAARRRPLDIDEESRWLRRVYQNLARGVIRQKRDGSELSLERALGILAYTKSFQKVARKYLEKRATLCGRPADVGEFPGDSAHNFDTLKASVEARIRTHATEARGNDSEARSRFSLAALALSFIAVNITIALNTQPVTPNANGGGGNTAPTTYALIKDYIFNNPLSLNVTILSIVVFIAYWRHSFTIMDGITLRFISLMVSFFSSTRSFIAAIAILGGFTAYSILLMLATL